MPRARSIPYLFPAGLAVALPLLTIHLCWWVSSAEGFIDWCVPYLEPCTSISRAGRYGSAWWLFKLLMLPAALCLVGYWWWCRRWLHWLTGKQVNSVLVLALFASGALVAYTVALGAGPGLYAVIRRAGVIVFFAFSFLALLRVGAVLSQQSGWQRTGRQLLCYSALLLAIGVSSVVHDLIDPVDHERWEDVYEWWLALLLLLQAGWVLNCWRRSGFALASP